MHVTPLSLMHDALRLESAERYLHAQVFGRRVTLDWSTLTSKPTTLAGYGITDAAALGQHAGINDQTGTAYTLVLSDKGKDVRCTNGAAITLTVPPNSSVAFPIGAIVLFSQGGAGLVTATAGAGVTLRAANGAATTAQYDARGLEKTDIDTWRVW